MTEKHAIKKLKTNLNMKAVKEFFDTHPGVNEVHEALGYLFLEKTEAEQLLAGTEGQKVTSYDRDHFVSIEQPFFAEESGELKENPDALKIVVGDTEKLKELENDGAGVIHNDATTYGKTKEEVDNINKENKEKIVKPAKESAKTTKAAKTTAAPKDKSKPAAK